MNLATWFVLLAAGWLAATVSGVAGFGGALLLLPVVVALLGARAAIPVLTVAQLMGNLSRAWFGRREIRWGPVLRFSAGALPASLAGTRLLVVLPPGLVTRMIGGLLLAVVVFRHTALGRRPVAEAWLAPAGVVVGLLSAMAGSAGPLGAAVFLGLHLPATAYVATEAVAAVGMHLAKSLVFGRYALLGPAELSAGLIVGGAMIAGSWTGRQLLRRIPEGGLAALIEGLLVVAGLLLLLGP